MKLTKAQQDLLSELETRKNMPVSSEYRPAQALVRLGLAKWEETRLGLERLILVEAKK